MAVLWLLPFAGRDTLALGVEPHRSTHPADVERGLGEGRRTSQPQGQEEAQPEGQEYKQHDH